MVLNKPVECISIVLLLILVQNGSSTLSYPFCVLSNVLLPNFAIIAVYVDDLNIIGTDKVLCRRGTVLEYARMNNQCIKPY
jgi:hypothetical protein